MTDTIEKVKKDRIETDRKILSRSDYTVSMASISTRFKTLPTKQPTTPRAILDMLDSVEKKPKSSTKQRPFDWKKALKTLKDEKRLQKQNQIYGGDEFSREIMLSNLGSILLSKRMGIVE